MSERHPRIGLGDPQGQFKVFIANRPDMPAFCEHQSIQPLMNGDIQSIGQACGNGWRKVFNLYAKLMFALRSVGGWQWTANEDTPDSWQGYREAALLQPQSGTQLLFSPPYPEEEGCTQIVMGKHYALSLDLGGALSWLDDSFARVQSNGIIVTPYFDYRQLTNQRLIQLVELLTSPQ